MLYGVIVEDTRRPLGHQLTDGLRVSSTKLTHKPVRVWFPDEDTDLMQDIPSDLTNTRGQIIEVMDKPRPAQVLGAKGKRPQTDGDDTSLIPFWRTRHHDGWIAWDS